MSLAAYSDSDLVLLREKRRRARQKQKHDAHPPSPLAWAELHRKIDEQDFSLARFRPLEQIYNDDHPHIVVIKPAQVGVSELAITRACHALDVGAAYWKTGKTGLNVGYIFATDQAVGDFSKERFAGLRSESDHLQHLFTAYNDVTFKQAGQSYLYLRGARSASGLKSFPADMLILDEFDEMDPAAVALARKRMRASLVKRELDISTPTIPGIGIHAIYLQSDQHAWEVPCPCGAWAELDFFRDVRADGQPYDTWKRWSAERLRRADLAVFCPSCGDELDRFAPGRWVARQPDVLGIRGYWVPALCFPSVSLTELVVAAVDQDPTAKTEFYRSDLGLPYEPSGSRMTSEMLKQLSHELTGGELPAAVWRQTTMGIDVGARWHYRISSLGPNGDVFVRAMGAVDSWDALDELMRNYKVRQCVVDAQPEAHGAREWAARHSGKVLVAYYPGPGALQGELFHVKIDEPVVQINRTMAMDAVYSAVATASEHWPASIHNDPDVDAHMRAPVRVTRLDKHGQPVAEWIHSTPDHLYHAGVYDHIARAVLPKSALSGTNISAIGGGVKGWQPV